MRFAFAVCVCVDKKQAATVGENKNGASSMGGENTGRDVNRDIDHARAFEATNRWLCRVFANKDAQCETRTAGCRWIVCDSGRKDTRAVDNACGDFSARCLVRLIV